MVTPNAPHIRALQSFIGYIRSGYIHSGNFRADRRTTGAKRTGNGDREHIYVRIVKFVFRWDQLSKIRALPGEMERNEARSDCPLVCPRADCLPNRADVVLGIQPGDVQHVADHDKLGVPSLVTMTANTTLQPKFHSASGPDLTQVMRRRVWLRPMLTPSMRRLTWLWLGRTMKSDGAWWVGTRQTLA